jgi:transcriptional regulator with XRE-family HTH domain
VSASSKSYGSSPNYEYDAISPGIFIMIETDFNHNGTDTENSSSDKMDLLVRETTEQTIQRVLSAYEIGQKLRQLRLKKKIALVDLGKHTGLSASMLSQLETGRMIPTLPTLARIAMVFDVGLDYFFDDSRRGKTFSIVRKEDRIRFPEKPDSPIPSYYFECLAFSAQEKGLQAYLAEFPPREPHECRAHMHEGSEFLYITKGELNVQFQGEMYALSEGDSAWFDSSEPHSYRSVTPDGAQALVIASMPRA